MFAVVAAVAVVDPIFLAAVVVGLTTLAVVVGLTSLAVAVVSPTTLAVAVVDQTSLAVGVVAQTYHVADVPPFVGADADRSFPCGGLDPWVQLWVHHFP